MTAGRFVVTHVDCNCYSVGLRVHLFFSAWGMHVFVMRNHGRFSKDCVAQAQAQHHRLGTRGHAGLSSDALLPSNTFTPPFQLLQISRSPKVSRLFLVSCQCIPSSIVFFRETVCKYQSCDWFPRPLLRLPPGRLLSCSLPGYCLAMA